MLPARKDEGSHVEDGVKKDDGPIERRVEVRLLRLEDKVTVIGTDLKEFQCEFKEFKSEIRSEFKSEANSFRAELNILRTRMEEGFQSMRKEINDAKIWALIIAAGMLGVMVRGFHWI
jgi:hypothetical protein